MKRRIIGLVEPIQIEGPSGVRTVPAKMDTGAARTSIDVQLAKKLGMIRAKRKIRIRVASLEDPAERHLVRAYITLHKERFRVWAGAADRSEMNYAAIVGRDILASGRFLIDPTRTGEKQRKRIAKRI